MKRMSLRLRIAGWFSLFGALLIGAFALVSQAETRRARLAALDRALETLAETIAGHVDLEDEGLEVDTGELRIERRFAADHVPRRVFAVVDLTSDAVLTQSPATDGRLLLDALGRRPSPSARRVFEEVQLADGTPIRLLGLFVGYRRVPAARNRDGEAERGQRGEVEHDGEVDDEGEDSEGDDEDDDQVPDGGEDIARAAENPGDASDTDGDRGPSSQEGGRSPMAHRLDPAARAYPALVIVGEDLRSIDAASAAQAAVFGWLVPLAVGLAVVAGWIASRRIVRPLTRMAEAAARIQRADSAETVPVPPTGDEIAGLAVTLNQTFARLHDAFERQARFTADAAHELRTPLAIILTQAEVALRRADARGHTMPATEATATLREITTGARRMQETLEGLLLLARADAGERPDDSGPCDLTALAREVCAALQESAAAAGHTLEAPGDVPGPVAGDARLLGVLVRNLVANAIQHSGRSATLRVSVERTDGNVVLLVQDTGRGIAAEALPQVFERFSRVDPGRSRRTGGCGLGLAIVRVIAELHGGTVDAASTPGSGSTFRVTLPALDPGAGGSGRDAGSTSDVAPRRSAL